MSADYETNGETYDHCTLQQKQYDALRILTEC